MNAAADENTGSGENGTGGTLTPESRASVFFKHPAILVVLGFVCTGLVGGWIADYWKAREWQNQQKYLAAKNATEKRYQLIDEAFKAVAETNTAAEDVLAGYRWTWTAAQIDERKRAWLTTSVAWRIKSKIVQQKLNIYFQNPAVQTKFTDIIDERRQVGNTLTNLLTSAPDSVDKTTLDEVQVRINKIKDDLMECGNLMAKELSTRAPN